MWHVEGEHFAAANSPFEHLFLKKQQLKILKLKISEMFLFYFSPDFIFIIVLVLKMQNLEVYQNNTSGE